MGRLEELAAEIPPSETVADIGCDHGLLAMLLLRLGKARRVIATDVSAPSLEKARRLAEREGLAMECRLGDGLTVLKAGEADCAVIAGMGGLGILSVLSDPRRTDGLTEFVLSPHSKLRELRAGLGPLGLCVSSERVIRDGGKYYHIMRVCAGERDADALEQAFGFVFDTADPTVADQLTERLARTDANLLRHGPVPALVEEKELLERALARSKGNP